MIATHSRFLIFIAIAATTWLVGCAGESSHANAHDHSEEPAVEAPTNRVDIPATVRNNLGITFASVERRRVKSTIRVPGAFELLPLARHEYRMTLPGHVDIAVDQYERVEAGDVLYRFRSPEWPELQHEIIVGEQDIDSAGASIDVARSRTDEAERRLAITRERIAALSGAEIRNAELEALASEIESSIPRLRAELGQAETSLANAERTREHALHRASAASGLTEAQLDGVVIVGGEEVSAYRTIDWIEVRASDSGVVETLAVTDGSYSDATDLVLSVVDPGMVRFRAMALQADIARFGESLTARIVPPMTPGVPFGDGIDAAVTLGLEAHPDQRTVTLIATPSEQRPWIRPGVSAFLEVVVESTGGPSLAIPRAAIVKDGIEHVFFRRDPNDPNKAIRTEADMGVDDGRWVAMNSGLMLNDQVVLDGVYELKLATQQSGVMQKGGHFHADGTFHADDH